MGPPDRRGAQRQAATTGRRCRTPTATRRRRPARAARRRPKAAGARFIRTSTTTRRRSARPTARPRVRRVSGTGSKEFSNGWTEVSVRPLQLGRGESVEISLAYVTDWATLEAGVGVDDLTLPDGTTTSFESDQDGWVVTGRPKAAVRTRTTGCGRTRAPVGETDGGAGLDFDFPADLNQHAQNYRDAAVTNLLYWNNTVHDVMYGTGSMSVRQLPGHQLRRARHRRRLRARGGGRRRWDEQRQLLDPGRDADLRRHAPNADVPVAGCPVRAAKPGRRRRCRFVRRAVRTLLAGADGGRGARSAFVYACTGCTPGSTRSRCRPGTGPSSWTVVRPRARTRSGLRLPRISAPTRWSSPTTRRHRRRSCPVR